MNRRMSELGITELFHRAEVVAVANVAAVMRAAGHRFELPKTKQSQLDLAWSRGRIAEVIAG